MVGIRRFYTPQYWWDPFGLTADSSFWTAPERCTVLSIVARVEVQSTDPGGVTAVIRKVPSGTAVASGTALHSGSINLKGTVNTNQTLTLSTTPTDLQLAAGDTIGIDLTGAATNAVGNVTVRVRAPQ